MKNLMTQIFTFLIAIFFVGNLQAQAIDKRIIIGDDSQVHLLVTQNDLKYYGQLIELNDEQLIFINTNGKKLIFFRENVNSIDLYEGISAVDFIDPNYSPPSHIMFTPTAFSVGEGNLQYRNIGIFYNQMNYGVSDYYTAGISLTPFIAFNFIGLHQKFNIPITEKVNWGLNGNLFVNADEVDIIDGSQVFFINGTSFTFGSTRSFFNISYHMLSNSSFVDNIHVIGAGVQFPIIEDRLTFALDYNYGMGSDDYDFRFSHNDNLFTRDERPVFITCLKFTNKKRTEFSVGVFLVEDGSFDDNIVGLPYFSWTTLIDF